MLWMLASCRIELGPPGTGPAAGASDRAAGEVWVYTSMYQSVIDAFGPVLERELPDVEVRWFQAGSEKVAQRIEAEWAAGGSPACLLLTSDPFWYAHLAEQGRLAPYLSPRVLQVDRSLVDDEGRWVTVRQSLMVLAVSPSVPPEDRPTSFADLADPRLQGKITMPDPLASGTAFTWLAFQPPDLVDGLFRNGVVAAGGSSAVLQRVASGERPVGVLLLENLLSSDGTPAIPVFPSDGAVAIPGPIALTAGCPNPVAAKAVYDVLLSPAGQELLVGGDMYAVLPGVRPPDGAPALGQLAVRRWEPGFAARVVAEQAERKEDWARRVSR